MTSSQPRSGRAAGLLLPLFSCPSSRSWGIGEFADLPDLAAWMQDAGLRLLQLLPLNEMAPGQRSPYSAISTMALDPIYIAVPRVPDFQALGGEASLDTAARGALVHARACPGVDYWTIRTLKDRALRASFRRFLGEEWVRDSIRAVALGDFITAQSWWLDDYALFRALHQATDGQNWRGWEAGLRDHQPGALERARRELRQEILFRQYLQWIAHEQWQAARLQARNLFVFGDLPFAPAGDSADVWGRQHLFSFAGTVGAPPDAFSKEGQNWKLPVYEWDQIAARQFDWFGIRGRRTADLFDGYRIDHVVGLFRTWVFPADGRPPRFTPSAEAAQLAQGAAVLSVLVGTGAEIIAEDLGIIPRFVRETLCGLGIPGYKVMRWERHWDEPGRPFSDPIDYPPLSVATSGTHDTEPLAVWWHELEPAVREAVLAIPSVRARLGLDGKRGGDHAPAGAGEPFATHMRDALLEALFSSGSRLVTVPVQDVFGWADRINVPAIVDETNWTYKLPWLVDTLAAQPIAQERQATLHRWAERHGRLGRPLPD